MNKRVIFFALFETEKSKHDRMELKSFGQLAMKHDLQHEFFDWIQEQRKIIEKETGKDALVVSINLIM